MTFKEWMGFSEVLFGEERMDIINQFFSGSISFEECVDALYKVLSPEQIEKLHRFMEIINQ